MAALVLDIAWDRPTVAQIKATGAVGVMRYFSTDDTKDLHKADLAAYTAAGIAVGTVYETTAGRATAGRTAGIADAKDAEKQRKAVGLPASHIHHFAVDKDVAWTDVAAYFDGVISVLGLARTACYGSYRVVQGAHKAGIRWLWQTLAWSGGLLSPVATLYQSGGTVLGGSADINKVTAASGDWGQTPRPKDPDMPMTPADVKLFLGTQIPEAKMPNGYIPTVADCLNGTKTADTQLGALTKQLTALSATVATVVGMLGSDVDTAAVVTAVEAAIAKAVVHVDVAVTGQTGA